MDASLDVQPETLLKLISDLKPMVAVTIVCVVGLWFIGNRFMTWLDRRAEARLNAEAEDARERRAAVYLDAMTKLATSVETLGHRIEGYAQANAESTAHLDDEVGVLQHNVRRMHRTVQDLRDRTAHVISRSESLAIIEAKFDDFVRNEAVAVFDQSLRRNAYAERKNFVQERVKTALRDIISGARDSLQRDYKALSANLEPFFPTRSGATGERFVLVDTLWNRVEPLYDTSRDVEARVEEMRIVVRNAVADHLAAAKADASDLYSVVPPHSENPS